MLCAFENANEVHRIESFGRCKKFIVISRQAIMKFTLNCDFVVVVDVVMVSLSHFLVVEKKYRIQSQRNIVYE